MKPTAPRNRSLADSFVEAVGALPCKGLSVFSGRFFSFDGDKLWGGRKPPLDISLGKGFKWKIIALCQEVHDSMFFYSQETLFIEN
jgi:hypothetical protein